MPKKVIAAGVVGWLVLALWIFVSNGIFGLRAGIDLKRIPDEARVYEVLKESIVEPGGYMCYPPLTPDGRFPPGEPVFGIRYSGSGHEVAGRMMVIHHATSLVAAMIVSWMLSVTSLRILSSYLSKVFFCASIGLLFAVFCDLPGYGIGAHTMRSALLLGGQSLVAWVLAGLAMAPCIRPDRKAVAADA